MWVTLRAIPRCVRGRVRGNRTLIVTIGLLLLLCFSYMEIFLVGRTQKLMSPSKERNILEDDMTKSTVSVTLQQELLPFTASITTPPTSPTVGVTTRLLVISPQDMLVRPTSDEQPKMYPASRFSSLGSELSFRSIRQETNWRKHLSRRYGELIQGLKSGPQELKERPGIPKWQIELRKQKYIVAAAFQPIISEMEYRILIETFYTLAEALVKANVTFFLYGGSHLGVYRHHGLVPWDDDIDIMLNSSQRERARAVLSNIPYYSLYSPAGHQWKFFETSLTTIIHKPYRWPFIDIFFFSENSTHIWDELPLYKNEFSYRKCDVFPLAYRPFEGGLVPVPCNSIATLGRSYSVNICKSNIYWHKYESYAPRSRKKIIRCSLIHEMFPFVFRSDDKQSGQEDRKIEFLQKTFRSGW